MINEENLNKLYESVIEGIELTTKELNSMGFNSRDLSHLIEQGSIIRVKRGIYELKSVDELYSYGKKLIKKYEHDKVNKCFAKCFEIDPTHKGVCFQLFLRSVKNKDYKKAFEYFDVFYNNENEFYKADSNFYLYMLSMITELPENYKEFAKRLKFSDFKVDFEDKRYDNVLLQNNIRSFALNQTFTLAIKQFGEYIKEKGRLSVQDILIKILLIQAITVQTQNRNTVIDLIKQKKYEEIIEFYKALSDLHNLCISDEYTLMLTKELLNLIESKSIPEKRYEVADSIFDAIDNKNYELALSLSSNKKQKYNLTSDGTINLLLIDIVNIIEYIKDNNLPVQEISETKKEETLEQLKREEKFIAKKYEELLKRKGIVLLDPMSNDRINEILEILKDYRDVIAFVIECGEQKQIVLKYKVETEEHINAKNIISLGNQAYSEKKYDECIEQYLKILQLFDEPLSFVYGKLGLAYMLKKERSLALEYITVANALAIKENLGYDYSELIVSLKCRRYSERVKKPHFKMTEQDFDYNDINNYYGLDFSEINSYIVESGLDVESACEQLGLTTEETYIVELIYAREFYRQGDFYKGDLFFKYVEMSKNKTKETRKILEEIRKNKLFYQNRQGDNPTELALSLVPKKKR